MKVRIIKKPNSKTIWWENHINDIIEIKFVNDDDRFPRGQIYKVIGPKTLLRYYKKHFNYEHLGISCSCVRPIKLERKKKIERIIVDINKKD